MDEEMDEHMLPVSFVRFGVLILHDAEKVRLSLIASHDFSAEVPAKETKRNLLHGL